MPCVCFRYTIRLNSGVRQIMREILKAPWSNQKVTPFVRGLAWVFVSCAAFSFSGAIYFTLKEGLPTVSPVKFLGLTLLSLYLSAVFLFVAVKGKAPSGWAPAGPGPCPRRGRCRRQPRRCSKSGQEYRRQIWRLGRAAQRRNRYNSDKNSAVTFRSQTGFCGRGGVCERPCLV